MRRTLGIGFATLSLTALLVGCQAGGPRMGGLNPFYQEERTTFQTPRRRIEAIEAIAQRSTGEDTPEQQEIVRELVATLASENDPLIRQAALETIADFNTSLSSQALLAGLSDADQHVRTATCGMLGKRSVPGSAEALSQVVRNDDTLDVRLAAAQALGRVGATEKQLLPLLEDRDPAMQLAGVEAMRRKTGRDLGGDVAAYVALAKGETPSAEQAEDRTSVAGRAVDWIPFF